MKREDLRNNIIPNTIENTDEYQQMGDEKFNTTDLIYLESDDEQFDNLITDWEREIFATDHAIMNNADQYSEWCRAAYGRCTVYSARHCDTLERTFTSEMSKGLRPSLHYNLPANISIRRTSTFSEVNQTSDKNEEFDIREIKDDTGKTLYHILQLGEYPKTKIDEELSKTLELLYNNGKLEEEITCTGRWYSNNGQKAEYKNYAGRHSPEFEYQKERYVREISYPNDDENVYSDGTQAGKKGTIRWVKVEPISWIIKNWDEMPKSINPKGNGEAKYFDLKAEKVITANIPFYPDEDDSNSTMWQNSTIRGFFNGIDVRNIQTNGNSKYGAERGGNFTGECNFLNEAFNLSREAIIEYTIPDSEEEIPDDAFNGCITLKRLTIHSRIKSIGKRAFDGLNFKYAYKDPTGNIVFVEELPKDKEQYKDAIELDKIKKSFNEFNYQILMKSDELSEIDQFCENLNKNKFSIPYAYGVTLIENVKSKLFCENSDFRFFKSEIPEINNTLQNFSEEEQINFYKFATNLGCFSTEKMLDKKGKETEVLLAQKASSVLAKLLKTDKMKLR